MHRFNQIIGIAFDFFLPKSPLDKAVDEVNVESLSKKLLKGRETENESIYALFDYQDELIRHMVWALKYRRNRRAAQIFAQILYDFLAEEFSDLNVYSDFDKPLLVPIPLFKKRLRKRGFNQTEILAKEIAVIGGDSFCTLHTGLLRKIKDTPSQTSLEREARLRNVAGAFAVANVPNIKNRNIVLLDDVTTTGATLNEARKTLLNSGAKSVLGVAVAH
ncbi:MAG: ComF family protein [Candidatus Pacebacteria bacterium]|jgi:competence protein ComFC|nr:hypothetical protein [Parcubacteria group bacterium]MDP6249437.1 ComF family protein [Candidatus Paceibacterota bacterium]MDP7159581.1 ComF family protein [Candidatus Paceibacterota bacterium]MDP7366300.1 ComF family protein [Candidatus Paceibacterota bacterium]MDP7466189.1 ComF family protein [Candidatus Paceibacterota bacterium]|tara:strand:+ start:7693 stop:8349 length:657 start_codon:yes stop_codon:yes gene_type:complete